MNDQSKSPEFIPLEEAGVVGPVVPAPGAWTPQHGSLFRNHRIQVR